MFGRGIISIAVSIVFVVLLWNWMCTAVLIVLVYSLLKCDVDAVSESTSQVLGILYW